MFASLVTPPSNDRWGKLTVKPGRNTWRLCVSREVKPASRVLDLAAAATAKLLSMVQPSTSFAYPYWGAWSPVAIAAGAARPIIPIDARLGEVSAALGLPAGELLGIRTMALPFPEDASPAEVSLGFPAGGYPCWWVIVDFWWRSDEAVFPQWPFVGGSLWDRLTGTEDPTHQVAVLDVALKPNAENDPGDKDLAEIAEETGREIVERTIDDWDKAVSAVGRFASSRGTAFALGAIATVLGLLWLRSRGARP
jgi:hypothetical protein